MPAVSKKQQKFMGMVHALNKGEIKPSDVSKDVQDVAKDMKKKDAKDFASTKHKGLPMKKEILNKLKEMIRQELSEYTYGVGDIVKDVNPTCLHYGAIGKVKEVNPEYVTFVVMNNGDRFKKGQTLEKSHDQMKKMNENKVYKVGDTISLLSFDRRNRGKAKVKSVAKSRPNKFGIKNHYITNKGTFTDMEVEGTEAFKLRFKGNTEKEVTKAMQSPGSAITRESVNEATFTPIDKIKDIKNLVKKGLVSYRGASGGFEISIRNKKVPGFPPSSELLYSGDPKKQKQYRDIRKKQFSIKPIATYFIKSDDLRKLQKLGQVSFLAPNKKESVNEFSMKLQKSTQDMVDALLKVKSPMPKEIESALIMMAKGYGLDYVKKEVQRDAKGFYRNLKQMAAAFPEFKKNPKDYKFESIIQERNDEIQTGKEYTKLWLQSIGLVIKQANNLKGALAKHPVKRDLNKLKAVENLFKKFIKPAIETVRASSRHYAPNQTELKKYLSNSKFKVSVRILRQTLESSNGYDENSWYDLDDKTKKLIEKMGKVLYDIENKMDKANLENINEKKKMFPPDKMTPKQAKEYKRFIDYAKMGIEYKIDMSLFESINESKEPEVITQLRDIVKRKTNKKIKDPISKRTMRVDMFTASAVTQVYDAVKKNSSYRKKFESLPLDKMAQLSFKMIRKGN